MGQLFLGAFPVKVDDKGRLFLPAKFREQLMGGVVMTRGHEHCLYVFPREVFVTNAERWMTAPMSNKQARDDLRAFLSGASDEVPDRQGRVTVPPSLREFAGITREVVVSGSLNKLELWDKDRYDAYIAAVEPAFADRETEVLPGLF